jgi:hypothetical protein
MHKVLKVVGWMIGGAVALFLAIAFYGILFMPGDSAEDDKQAQAESGQAEEKAAAEESEPEPKTESEKLAARVEDQFIPGTNQHEKLTNAVLDRMENPNSFQHVQTKLFPLGEDWPDGTYGLQMEFRGENSFGATVTNMALGVAKIESGEIVQVSIESD